MAVVGGGAELLALLPTCDALRTGSPEVIGLWYAEGAGGVSTLPDCLVFAILVWQCGKQLHKYGTDMHIIWKRYKH